MNEGLVLPISGTKIPRHRTNKGSDPHSPKISAPATLRQAVSTPSYKRVKKLMPVICSYISFADKSSERTFLILGCSGWWVTGSLVTVWKNDPNSSSSFSTRLMNLGRSFYRMYKRETLLFEHTYSFLENIFTFVWFDSVAGQTKNIL